MITPIRKRAAALVMVGAALLVVQVAAADVSAGLDQRMRFSNAHANETSERFLSPHPDPLPQEREQQGSGVGTFASASASAARASILPLPEGEGRGEGERYATSTNTVSDSTDRTLEQSFVEPPASARPWVYWFVMDGNLSREGITADFEALQHAGIGGVIIMEVNVGIPRGPVNFMSPEWRATVQARGPGGGATGARKSH